MKLKRLELKAFGPFTNRILDFTSKGPGLHVIFGPNESGKSSSLRGLRALLFGFPAQTPDNFLHSYDQLLVAGLLENRDGRELVFQRRKKRINDLMDEHGEPLAISTLMPFLHGVESEIFQSLYGIDHDRLVQGGKEILDQQGEVGKSLFAAGAGISSLKEVIDELEQESIELFKPRGSNPEINQAIKRYKELKKAVKEASLAPKEWITLKKSLDEAVSALNRLEEERNAKDRERRSLDRLSRAIPELSVLQVLQDKVKALGHVVTLPPDVQERQKEAEQANYKAESQLQHSSKRLQTVQEKLQPISLNMTLLEQSDLVDDFHQRLGAYKKGQDDSPRLNGMRISLRSQASSFLKEIRPDVDLDDVDILRPIVAKKRTVQALSTQFEAVSQNVTQAKRRSIAAQRELDEIETILSATPAGQDTEELHAAVKLARKAGDLDLHIRKVLSLVEQGRDECLSELKHLGLWSGDITALVELPLPLAQTIQGYEQKFRAIAENRRALRQERKGAVSLLDSAERELRRIQYSGDIPSEEDLHEIRERRDAGWQLLCRQWLAGENISDGSRGFDGERSLLEAYEDLVSQADIVADRLRNEADRVANSANLKAQIEQQREVLGRCEADEGKNNRREDALIKEWRSVWQQAGISPLSPDEMQGWLSSMEQLRLRMKDLARREKEVADEVERRQALIHELLTILSAMGEKELPSSERLAPLVVVAERVLEENKERQNKRKLLMERQKKAQNNVTEAMEELRDAEDAHKIWQEQWQKTVAILGVQGEITPLDAMDFLETLQNCLDLEKKASELQKRIDGIARDGNRLEQEVKTVLEKTAPSLLDLPVDQAILELRVLLRQAQEEKSLHDQLRGEMESLQTDISTAKKQLQEANSQMTALLDIAKCKTWQELGQVISRFLEYQNLQEKITVCEETLARIGEGIPVRELASQAEAFDADELPLQVESLRQDIEDRINPAITEISQRVGEIKNKLAAMDGGGKAADLSEKMEQELTKIRRLVERYTRVKLASKLLQQEVERYREQHQGPLLKLASHYFKELTLQSFSGLRADMNDKGEPVLEGIRADGTWTGVSGMSDGTRDQLYLSLRLATLEWRMKKSEPFPFIVDDILINFDDDRSRATLNSLARFSRKNQVILFTHHRQLLDDAREIGETEEVIIHTL